MEQHQSSSNSNSDQLSRKPGKERTKNQPFVFDYIPIVDETALANLFDQLRVETNGKLVHPQWKHFRHMKMIRNDRTRLSNAIWRSWFLQMKQNKKPVFCQFHVDVSLQEHQVPQAVPIEGKYWKRRSEAVATEYKKWRLYYKQKRMFNQRRVQQSAVGDVPGIVDVQNFETTPANVTGVAPTGYYFLGDEFQDIPDNLLNTQLPYLLGSADRMMDTADTYQPSLDNLNPNPFIEQLMDDTWMDFQQNLPKGPLDQVFNSTAPVYFKSSPRRVPFANDTTMPYGILLPGEQFSQQSKSTAEITAAHDTGSGSTNGHVSDSMLVKTEAPTTSNCTELKDVPYIPRGSSSSSILPATVSAPPTIPQSQSMPAMGQYTGPVFQGLLDPKAQYHKSLAEHSRMEQVQRKQLEEANKQQQLYIQLLQQYSNQLPESTRPQAEMLQALLADPNMVNMLQHIFKGQQQSQEQSTSPTTVTNASPVQRTPPVSAPPNYSPGPSSSSAVNQTMFQYHSGQLNGSQEFNQVSAEAFSVETPKPVKPVTPEERKLYKEVRRQSHITAEQKRRGNIKAGLDQLQILISRVDPSSQSQSKMSKANVLTKSVEYIQRMHARRESVDAEIASLQTQVQQLNNAINRLQEQLPASGAASGSNVQQYQENQQRFTQYVCERSTQNYRFWIFSLMAQSLFDSYNSMVCTSNMDEFCSTAAAWNDQQCSLVALRPVVQDGLRKISQTTSILTQPANLPQQLIELIQEQTEKLQANMDSTP